MEDKIILALFAINVLFAIVVFGFIVFLIPAVHKAKQAALRAELTAMKATYDKQLLQNQVEIQEETLKMVSGELHDNIGQKIYLSKLILATLDASGPADTANREALETCLTEAGEGLHELLNNLSPELIKKDDLRKAIGGLVRQLERTRQYTIDYENEGGYKQLPEQKELIIFRIFQEAINNIIRHAAAHRIEIRLVCTPEEVCLSIADDGKGFAVEQARTADDRSGHGRGLGNMVDRAALINAQLSITTQPGAGTTVRITVSVKD